MKRIFTIMLLLISVVTFGQKTLEDNYKFDSKYFIGYSDSLTEYKAVEQDSVNMPKFNEFILEVNKREDVININFQYTYNRSRVNFERVVINQGSLFLVKDLSAVPSWMRNIYTEMTETEKTLFEEVKTESYNLINQ